METEQKTTNPEKTVSQTTSSGKSPWLMIAIIIGVGLVAGAYYLNKDASPAATEGETTAPAEPIALVNGIPIDRQTYANNFEQIKANQLQAGTEMSDEDIKRDLLEGMISEEVLVQEADKEGVEPNIEQVDQQIEQLSQQLETNEELKQQLQKYNTTIEDIRNSLLRQAKIEAYFDKVLPAEEIEVTEEELQTQFDTLSEQLQGDDAPTFEEIKPSLTAQLQQSKRQEKVLNLVEELKAEANIERNI